MDKKSRILGMVLALGLFFIGFNPQGLAEEQGLVGWWKFDEGEGGIPRDSSGKGNDVKIQGAAWAEGIKGKALKFDGKDDYLDCGNDASLNVTDAITIEAWVKVADIAQAEGGIVSKHTNWAFTVSPTNNCIWLYKYLSVAPGYKLKNIAFTNWSTSWNHFALVISGKNAEVFVNGVSVGKRVFTESGFGSLTNHVLIGVLSPGVNHFNGTIDEVRIYNRALSKEEIKKHYQELGEIIAEKEKEEMQAKLKVLSSQVKDLSLKQEPLFSNPDYSIPEAWNYLKIYKEPFYYGTQYMPELWEKFHIDQEAFIKDSLALVRIWGNKFSSPPGLLSSDKPIILYRGGAYDFLLEEKTFDKIKAMYGPRYVAIRNNFCQEWTRLWKHKKNVEYYSEKAGFSHLPKDRKEAHEMAGAFLKKRFAKYTPGQKKQIIIIYSPQDHYTMSLPEVAIEGFESYGHYPFRIASARGASRQYQKPWLAYLASHSNLRVGGKQTVTDYFVPFPDCYSKIGSGRGQWWGPYGGLSPSLHKRAFYGSYMGGTNFIQFEQDGIHTLLIANYDFRTIAEKDRLTHLLSDGSSDKKYHLSPVGYDFKQFYDNIVQKQDRGIPYTPVGLLFDQYHNLTIPYYSLDDGIGIFPFTDADYMMRAVINGIWPWEERDKQEIECMTAPPPFGDIFDFVTNTSSLDNLKNYQSLFMVGNVDIDKSFYNKLTSYVKSGGNLFINIEQINEFFTEKFLGVKLTKNTHQGSSFYSILDGEIHSEKNFTFKEVVPIKAKSLIISPESNNPYPLVTENRYGKGKVFLTTPYYLYVKGSKNKMLNLFSYLMKRINDELSPISIEGEIEYQINRNKNGWVLTLINNEGVTKFPLKKAIIDPKKEVEVKITLNKDFRISKVNEWTTGEKVREKEGSFKITVPPGDIRIIEFKGDQS